MPPKIKITKDDIIQSALNMIRENGAEVLNARTLASRLGCSTQPIFSNFDTMEEVRLTTMDTAYEMYQNYIKREIDAKIYPPYKASGMAYIRFAKEEKELFKLLFMRDRSLEAVKEDTQDLEFIYDLLQKKMGLSREQAMLFHLEMWAYVHGIAVMIATNYLELEWELISEMTTDVYLGMEKRFEEK